ncbi:hypothetical protein F4781DRAFT_334337 [Annulohypoxylon bovei var. microspora]|nr:hypothetical protein F4781DRAFT_334337 [Annulohypoxylon bovei var. microspora]
MQYEEPLFIIFLVRLPVHLGDELFDRRLGLILKMSGSVYERVGFIDSFILESETRH